MVTEENYIELPQIQSPLHRCFPCSRSFNRLGYRLHVQQQHGSTEPTDNFDTAKLEEFENLTKVDSQ